MASLFWMGDNALDTAFAAAFDHNDRPNTAKLADEIVGRATSPLSFAEGLVGHERFPLYNARMKFSQTSAQTAVAESAKTVAGKVATVASDVAAGAFKFALPAILAGVGVWLLYGYVKGRGSRPSRGK